MFLDQGEPVRLPSDETYRNLDEVRRVMHSPERRKLFVRAAPSDEYLVFLSQAGALRALGLRETDCKLDVTTGERLCEHTDVSPARLDCRLPSCEYSAIMRMRLVIRLRGAYALERKRLVGR